MLFWPHKTKIGCMITFFFLNLCETNFSLILMLYALKALSSDCVEPQKWLHNWSVVACWYHTVWSVCQCLSSSWLLNSQSYSTLAWRPTQTRLFLRPRGFHGHAGANHCRIAPVPPHAVRPKRGAGPAQPTQGPQDGAGTHCSAPRGSGHSQPLHLVQQVEIVDGDAHVGLAFAVPPSLPAPHPTRHLLQNGAGWLGGQEVVVGRALEVKAGGGRRGGRPLARGWIWRRGGAQRVRVWRQVGGDGGAEKDSPDALAVLQALALVIHSCWDPSLLEEADQAQGGAGGARRISAQKTDIRIRLRILYSPPRENYFSLQLQLDAYQYK